MKQIRVSPSIPPTSQDFKRCFILIQPRRLLTNPRLGIASYRELKELVQLPVFDSSIPSNDAFADDYLLFVENRHCSSYHTSFSNT